MQSIESYTRSIRFVIRTLQSPLVVVAVVLCAVTGQAAAQEPPPPPPKNCDSLPIVLGEIVIEAAGDRTALATFTSARVSLAAITRQDPAVVADFARLIPAAYIQTNSRGETLVYLRNAGERQVGVFFDGALLNIPWDNRVDLSLIPASAIGGISVAKGVPPVEYGTNVLGGAVNFTSRMSAGPWSETELQTRFGTEARRQGSLTHRGTFERLSFTGSIAYSSVDGLALPSGAGLPFSQPDNDIRTNTDSRVANVFAGGVYQFDNGTRLGLTLLHADAAKGVAPESHLDPSTSRVRFWRYPEWRNSVAIFSGEGMIGAATSWKGSTWINAFAQDIESYGSATYDIPQETQEDRDLTLGTRLTVSRTIGSGVGKISFNGLTSRHRQRDVSLDASGQPMAGVAFPRLQFKQHLLSVGAQYSFNPARHFNITVGASGDAMFLPGTGDKPARDPFADYSATFAANYDAGTGWFVRASAGRKTRFPTMRELFGESLDRFLLNPGLTSESSILTEIAIGVMGEHLSGEIIPFGTFTSGTIDQQSIQPLGETRPRRQRINLRGSRVLGVELVGAAYLERHLDVEAHLTLMSARRLRDNPGDPTQLSEKPEILGRLATTYHTEVGTVALFETVYTGRAYSLDDNNQFVPLNTSLVFNVRISQTVKPFSGQVFEVFIRAENITDEVVLSQLGLPEAGRVMSSGVKVTL